ncbi:hypothetical protein CVT26_001387 [Gymnopilus dilepis]|uniref:Uncharacterized protein n=1 Tax=Gymnopilus dilepis TaxID=231916 RepID=A0A409WVY3_9AGAR|nr:hypothetical protein CVT26_001387 [Gymnopilus dilepis]
MLEELLFDVVALASKIGTESATEDSGPESHSTPDDGENVGKFLSQFLKDNPLPDGVKPLSEEPENAPPTTLNNEGEPSGDDAAEHFNSSGTPNVSEYRQGHSPEHGLTVLSGPSHISPPCAQPLSSPCITQTTHNPPLSQSHANDGTLHILTGCHTKPSISPHTYSAGRLGPVSPQGIVRPTENPRQSPCQPASGLSNALGLIDQSLSESDQSASGVLGSKATHNLVHSTAEPRQLDKQSPTSHSELTLPSRESICLQAHAPFPDQHVYDVNAHPHLSILQAEPPASRASTYPPSLAQSHPDDGSELEAQNPLRSQQSTNHDLETILKFLDHHSSAQERAGSSVERNVEDDHPGSRVVESDFSNVIAFLGQQGLRPRAAASGARENRRSPKTTPQDITSGFSDVITFIQQQSLRPRDPKPAVVEKHEAPVLDKLPSSRASSALQEPAPNALGQDDHLRQGNKPSSDSLPADRSNHKLVDAIVHYAQMEEARASLPGAPSLPLSISAFQPTVKDIAPLLNTMQPRGIDWSSTHSGPSSILGLNPPLIAGELMDCQMAIENISPPSYSSAAFSLAAIERQHELDLQAANDALKATKERIQRILRKT